MQIASRTGEIYMQIGECQMTRTLFKGEFVILKDYIEKTSGIHISDDKEYLIRNRLIDIMNREQIDSFSKLCERVIEKRDLMLSEKIIDAITTNETLWFRDKGTWRVFEEQLMPKFIKSILENPLRNIKIWSCACSTGQEPYTIAMIINRFIKKHNLDNSLLSRFSILATDISDRVLNIAKQGVYDEAMMGRGLDEEYREMFFNHIKGSDNWELIDDIKRMVKFKNLNLKNMFYFNEKDFELVFVRNVLIYFNEDLRGEILSKLANSMTPSGNLFVGASELIQNSNFNRMEYKGNVYYSLSI